MKQVAAVFLGCVLFCRAVPYAEEEKEVVVTPHGFAYFQVGQLQHITPSDQGVVPKTWDQQKVNMRLTLDAVVRKNLRIIVGAESEMQANIKNSSRKRFFDCKEAQGIYSWGDDLSKPFFQCAMGYFPFKYNPDASNLGEYLYRAGAYPQWIITDFDNAKMRLIGTRISFYPIDGLSLDGLFTSGYNEAPILDYSLSFLAGYKLFDNLLDVGGGIMFDHLIPVDSGNIHPNHVVIKPEDTANIEYYTVRGTKIAARAAVDFKWLLPADGQLMEFMGKKGLRLYSEVAVLGWKNYNSGDTTTYYSDRSKRMPIMFGFNAPTWFLLDLLSIEFEYFNVDRRYKADFPTASTATPNLYTPATASRTMWKWSVFAEKEVVKGWAIKGLVARDHYRGLDDGGNFFSIETMNGPGDWHYNVRVMYSF